MTTTPALRRSRFAAVAIYGNERWLLLAMFATDRLTLGQLNAQDMLIVFKKPSSESARVVFLVVQYQNPLSDETIVAHQANGDVLCLPLSNVVANLGNAHLRFVTTVPTPESWIDYNTGMMI